MNNHIYLAHHGIKGMKWGVRRFQNEDGSLTSAGKRRAERNRKYIQREISFQEKKIDSHNAAAKAYRDSAADVRKRGFDMLKAQGYSDKTAREAVRLASARRDTEAQWHEHQAKHLRAYNTRLQNANVDEMTRRQVWKLIQDEGNVTLNEINSSWVEPDSTKEYADAIRR